MAVRSTAIQLISDIYIGNEIPSGDIDSVNKDFVLVNTPVSSSVVVRLSGVVQVPGLSKDYTLSGSTITFIKAPKVGQEVVTSYFTT